MNTLINYCVNIIIYNLSNDDTNITLTKNIITNSIEKIEIYIV